MSYLIEKYLFYPAHVVTAYFIGVHVGHTRKGSGFRAPSLALPQKREGGTDYCSAESFVSKGWFRSLIPNPSPEEKGVW